MNLLLNKNLQNAKKRFPLMPFEQWFCKQNDSEVFLRVEDAKNGQKTLIEVSEKTSLPLHSKYDPQTEAKRALEEFSQKKYSGAVFCSPGLGYECILFASLYPDVPLIIIEPSEGYLKAAFENSDWEKVFLHKALILLCGCDEQTASQTLGTFDFTDFYFFKNKNRMAHAQDFYRNFFELLEKKRQVKKVNNATLEKFSSLWLKNSIKNLKTSIFLDGIEKYEKCAEDIPCTIVAAGPSLQKIIPFLSEIKKRSITICVNTALHVFIQNGVEPDFIIITDPQYAAYNHLSFYKSPSSRLIAESAVYPKTFGFKCSEIVLCSSMFPIGQYFEQRLCPRGRLGAGGSVSTSAWDFARYIGSKKIFLAGLDLGFPFGQTHIKGSQFEEKSHTASKRYIPAETTLVKALLDAPSEISCDYRGKALLTDVRMQLFAAWFESSVQNAAQEKINTFTLTPESRALNGITPCSIEDFLKLSPAQQKKDEFFKKSEINKKGSALSASQKEEAFYAVLADFKSSLLKVSELSQKGKNLCKKALSAKGGIKEVLSELDLIDRTILSSEAKDAASLVFPTKNQLQNLESQIKGEDPLGLKKSSLIYSLINGSAEKILLLIKKYL